MAPLVALYIIPIGLIAVVIIAIIRLIIRAVNSGNSNNQTNYTQYKQPPYTGTGQQNPYNTGQNPGTNPYNTNPNPYNTNPNPYNTNPNPYNTNPNPYVTPTDPTTPADPNSPPPIPNYQQPNYNQPNYQQPNYGQPNYQQPNYAPSTYSEPGTYNPVGNTRSTSIGNTNYQTHVGATDKKKNPAVMIILIIVGVVVLLGGGIAYVAYQRNAGADAMISSDFRLAYDNPTENTYYIVLDEWDTIKVEPFTSSEDLDYTHRRGLTDHHWQMLDSDYKVIADTTVSKYDMETWVSDRTAYHWNYSTVTFNPSGTQFVYYNSWFDEIGLEYMDDFKVGDSTYYADAYTVSNKFIFDGRDPEFQTDLDEATTTSDYQQQQFLLNAYDFVVLYHKLNAKNPQRDMMEEYQEQLSLLADLAYDEAVANSAYDVDDMETCNILDSLNPSYVDEDTEPRDFINAIDFVKANATFFRATAREQYNFVVDSADVLLKHAYVQQDRPESFMSMTIIDYMVTPKGLTNSEAEREESWRNERNTDTGSQY